jgi:uncharacterized protein DUF4440
MSTNDSDMIQQIIKNINQAWLMERFEELDQYLHPEVIYVQPKSAGRLEGRAACVSSYRDFVSQATIREYRDGQAQVNLFGSTAVATYPFHILYELAGESYRENGYDTLVFAKNEGVWRVVWRTIFINPGVTA